MGHCWEPTPEMGPYRVETRRESFNLSGPKDRLTNTTATWSIPVDDAQFVLAALDQVVGPPHEGYRAWEAIGRPNTGDLPPCTGEYPATVNDGRATFFGPAYLYERTDDTWPWNSIELCYDAVEPIRDTLNLILAEARS